MTLAINAHTDNKGRDSYNLGLSQKRAVSAVKYLIKNGISKKRLQSNGFGETKPLVDCKNDCSDEDLQANRRVEFVILKE
ncbi:OmpA family protein [Flaviramulus basaltis]|uniref:OmpA family protein n=2 Tax=Flaviramulus basaltis TaxID=369401 RepID=A0A1K2IEI7_9FLAO|nr:OmpA family protein [Flaviramulus basaltis]